MQDETVKHAMWLAAALTPVLGLALWFTLGRMEAGAEPDAAEALAAHSRERRLRLKCAVLAAAGPANLACWYHFNRWLEQLGYRSVIGYVLAAVVFLAGGMLTGFFSNRFGRGRK